MTPNYYRDLARQHLKEAKANHDTDDPVRLRDSALALRMVIEALTYERAYLYKDDLPPDHKTWQPRKLMEDLLQIDPYADKSISLSFGKKPSAEERAEKMFSLGTENVIGQKTIKEHYDALGSYLHVPTIKQLADDSGHNLKKLRVRCRGILEDLEKILGSPVMRVKMRRTISWVCSGCKNDIRRCFVKDQGERKVECFNCEATYILSEDDSGNVIWEPHLVTVKCPNNDCNHEFDIWEKEVKQGTCGVCPSCKKYYRICLGVEPYSVPSDNAF